MREPNAFSDHPDAASISLAFELAERQERAKAKCAKEGHLSVEITTVADRGRGFQVFRCGRCPDQWEEEL